MKTRTQISILASATVLFITGCRSGTDTNSKRVDSAKEDESKGREVETQNFTSTTSDGRPHVFASWANYYDKIDFSKLHPRTRDFYKTTSQTNVFFRNDAIDRKSLWTFTNFQDSVAVADVIKGVRRACQEEQYSSIKACVDDAIARSGSVVFAMKNPEGSATDPNSDGHIKDALYGLMGATFIVARNEFGVNEERMTAACISCHNSTYTKQFNRGTTLVIDGRGDNSYADALAKRDYLADFNKFKQYVNDPNDPIWNTSPETRAAGYVAAQYFQLKDAHGHKYNIDEMRLSSERQRGNVKAAVEAGWVSAFANWISTAESFCYSNNLNAYFPSTACGIKDSYTSDSSIARSTAKTTAVRLIAERDNLLRPWSVTPPLRSQRSIVYEPILNQGIIVGGAGSHLSSRNFALDYVRYSQTSRSDSETAIPYLLSATSISVVMPGVRDDGLARAWYGGSMNALSAEQEVNRVFPKTIPAGYTADAKVYHEARFKSPLPLPGTLIQTISQADILAGATTLNSCTSCHMNFKMPLAASSSALHAELLACKGKGSCDIYASALALNATTSYAESTPTSRWAQSVMAPMETAPASMHGGQNPVPAQNILSSPFRISFINRQSIGLWGYLSNDEALKPAKDRHAPAYGIVDPVMSLDRKSVVRTVEINWDFDGDGLIAKEKLFCLQSQAFDLDRNGTKETSCFEALRVLGGGTPRPLGESDSKNIHSPHFAGLADSVSRSRLARVLAAYSDGAFMMRWNDNTLTHIKMIGSSAPGSVGTGGMSGGGSGDMSGGGSGGMLGQ